jgi:hypothetical protein
VSIEETNLSQMGEITAIVEVVCCLMNLVSRSGTVGQLVFGFHPRASRSASAIWAEVI